MICGHLGKDLTKTISSVSFFFNIDAFAFQRGGHPLSEPFQNMIGQGSDFGPSRNEIRPYIGHIIYSLLSGWANLISPRARAAK